VRGVTRLDAAVAAGFVLAAAAESVVLRRATPGLLAFGVCGAPVLAVLAVRRTRPVLTMCVIAGFGVVGTVAQALLWPDTDDSGGVWMFALLLAAYSLGVHGRGRVVALGGLAPLLVVLAADLPTVDGWQLVSGVLFVTVFVGILPTAVGRVVRVRRDRLAALEDQRARIVREQRNQRESAVLAERLRTNERLRPALLDGMRRLAEDADAGAEPGLIEATARELLARTREEVVALTAPIDVPAAAEHSEPGAVRSRRAAAWPWAVVAAVAVGWCAVAVLGRVVGPLDGTLGETAFALSSAFGVALLSQRPAAIAGLVVCLLGQQVGVGADDPVGEAAILVVCWLGGRAVNEVTRLLEQSHAYNRLLAEQQASAAQRAVVDERFRLARELHDQIGHTLTVVALQAGAARRLGTSDPGRARSLLLTIATAARDGLAALDGTEASRDLATVIAVTRTAGLRVDADIDDQAALDAEQSAVVFRLVQEALTNVLRHAPGARASVTVRQERYDVVVTIANSAPTHAGNGPGTGRGLAGIRERVAARHGRVSWGPRAEGGFEVRAVLPAASLEGATR
jgi:signal transduction histidine kinase